MSQTTVGHDVEEARPNGQVFLSDSTPLCALQQGHYGVIHADCPWRFKNWSKKGEERSPSAKYPTMPTEELIAMDVSRIAADDCALFLWCLGEMLSDALSVMEEWQFNYSSIGFNWTKICKHGPTRPRMGMGYTTRKSTELCLLGFRGRPERMSKGILDSIWEPRREHSRKPDETFERIERLYGGPYIDLFGRQPRKNWDVWGKEAALFSND